MIKHWLVGLGVMGASLMSVFAFTPTESLQTKLGTAVTIFEDMIEQKGETYRTTIISVLDMFSSKYAGNERAAYIVGFLKDALSDVAGASYANTYVGSYVINDATYGTKVSVEVDATDRTIVSNALPNHETGVFPNPGNPNTIAEQEKEWAFPLEGTYEGEAQRVNEVGVAVNGIKFQPETGERVECETGEVYKIEALQDSVDLGIDHQHAHVQPTGEYHYHGISEGLVDQLEGDDIVHMGFAADGFKIVYSTLGTYSSSFELVDEVRTGTSCEYRGTPVDIDGTTPDGTYVVDWEYTEGLGDLDACNGMMLDGEYVYVMTTEYPYIGRCLNGEVVGGGGPGGGGQGGPGGGAGGPPPTGGAGGPPPRQ